MDALVRNIDVVWKIAEFLRELLEIMYEELPAQKKKRNEIGYGKYYSG